MLEVWSKHPISSVSDHHADDSLPTSDSLVKSQKGKVRYPCLLCKDMHRTYLCPRMDEASKLLEYLTVPQQKLPIGYHKLSLDIPLVDQVVDPSPFLVNPTLPLKSEVEVVDPVQSLVDPNIPLESEVKMVESMISPPNPTLLLESVETELLPST